LWKHGTRPVPRSTEAAPDGPPLEPEFLGRVATAPLLAVGGRWLDASLREHLRERLPEYMVPAAFVRLEALPLTVNGKLDRHALPLPGARSVASQPGRAPESTVERRVAEIWCELLKVENVSVHDDFFALGGHSLLAIRMFSRIRATFGRSLPFSTLLQHPTIARLASVLESPPRPAARASVLVPLKREGRRPPLFLLPGIGNEVWTFLELSKAVDKEQPVYGVLTADGHSDGPRSIMDLATVYADEVEAALPDGPFILGGYCSGAVTAFEVARQLKLRGKPVQLLVVFEYWRGEVPWNVGGFLRNAALWLVDDLLRSTLRHNLGRLHSKSRLLWTRLARRLSLKNEPDDIRDVLGMWRYSDQEAKQLEQHMEAVYAYRFSRFDSPIHVFKARARSFSRMHPSGDMGWTTIAEGPLMIETVPGSHDTMLATPFVQTLARSLDAAINRAATAAVVTPAATPERADG
jgi:thioesterase domain-containing protein